MMYEGYRIVHDRGHILVIAPDGTSWTEDTVEDAKRTINEEEQRDAGIGTEVQT